MEETKRGKAGVAFISIDSAKFVADSLATRTGYGEDEAEFIEKYLEGLVSKFDSWTKDDFERAFRLVVNLEASRQGISTEISINKAFDEENKVVGVAQVNFNLDVVLNNENKQEAFMKELYSGTKAVIVESIKRITKEDVTVEALKYNLDYYALKADELLDPRDRVVKTPLIDIDSKRGAIASLNNLISVNNEWPLVLQEEFGAIKKGYEDNIPTHLNVSDKKYHSIAYRAISSMFDARGSEVLKKLYKNKKEKAIEDLEKFAQKGTEQQDLVDYQLQHNQLYTVKKFLEEGNKDELVKIFKKDSTIFLNAYRYIKYEISRIDQSTAQSGKTKAKLLKKKEALDNQRILAKSIIEEYGKQAAPEGKWNIYVESCPNGSNTNKASNIVALMSCVGTIRAYDYFNEHWGILNNATRKSVDECARALDDTGVAYKIEPAVTCLDRPTR